MDASKRILIVARHYWPCTTDATLRLRLLSKSLQQAGWAPTVLTPRWHASWPQTISVGDVAVVRIDDPPLNPLRQAKYCRNLNQWLNSCGDPFQAILCDQVEAETLRVLDWASSMSLPVVVRIENRDWNPEQPEPKSGGLLRTTLREVGVRATRVQVPSPSVHQQLIGLGIPPERILRCSDWTVSSLDRTPSARHQARHMLAEINCDLNLHVRDRLVVVPGDLSSHWNIDFLIESLWRLLDERPGLRLWIHGDGRARERVYSRLKYHGIHRLVALPGMFTCIEPLLQAADLCLFPAPGCGLGYLIPTCLMSRIPILAARSSELANRLGGSASPLALAMTFEPDSPMDLEHRVSDWLESPVETEHASYEAQRWIRQRQIASAEYPNDLVTTLGELLQGNSFDVSRTMGDRMRLAQ